MIKHTVDELMNMSPVDYAKSTNEHVTSQAVHEGWSFWTLLPEDSAFFDEMGITNAYEYRHMIAADTLSDVYKEIYNIRPRGVYPINEMTLDDIENEIERLYATNDEDTDDVSCHDQTVDSEHLRFSPFANLAKHD